jgi:hypothetical protein
LPAALQKKGGCADGRQTRAVHQFVFRKQVVGCGHGRYYFPSVPVHQVQEGTDSLKAEGFPCVAAQQQGGISNPEAVGHTKQLVVEALLPEVYGKKKWQCFTIITDN